MKLFSILIAALVLSSCATTRKLDQSNIELTYLDDFVLPQNLEIDGSLVGGISGIDYHDGKYYLVCDQPSNPRIYKAEIPLSGNRIDTVIISEVIKLQGNEEFFRKSTPDLEAIRFDSATGNLVVSSEGSINSGKNPAIFYVDQEGKIQEEFEIPQYFEAKGEQKPRHNGVFEGLAESYDGQAYWVGMELPLENDGPKPKIYKTHSPVRITRFDRNSKKPEKQFAYPLDGIAKLPINWFAVNGLTELLEYDQQRFLVLERAYSAGYGSHGNTVKIFDVDASNASDVLEIKELKKGKYQPAEKRLVFNFKSVKKQLTQEIIDNLEGMSFGPVLPNGNRSLILVSDDNFSSFGHQITQFILLEINIKN